MQLNPLDAIPLWGLLFAAIGLLWLAIELGYRFGTWRRFRINDEQENTIGAMVASILGLVALVLGFTVNLAALRFDTRRLEVLKEANAIGTTFLRTRFLPDPQRQESAQLLREYTDVRLEGVLGGDLDLAISRSEALQESLWRHANEAVKKDPHSISTGLYVQSLNDVIDSHANRLWGMRSRIPFILWIALYLLAILGMASVGYQAALTNTRRSPVMGALVLAFAGVLFLIADLDRGQEGLLRISQQSLIDARKSMGSSQP